MHYEVPVKVNAWVDEGIAPLVLALCSHRNIWTLDSCQNDQSSEALGAYVMFAFQGDPDQADRFGDGLASRLEASPPFYRLEVDRRAGEDSPVLTLSCPPSRVRELARAVSSVRMRP